MSFVELACLFRELVLVRLDKDTEALSEADWARKKGLQPAASDGKGTELSQMVKESLVSDPFCQQLSHKLAVEKSLRRSLSSCASGAQKSL